MHVPDRERPSPSPSAGRYPDRYIELFERRGEPFVVIGGRIYTHYNRMVVPFGPVDADYTLSREEATRALKHLGGVLVRTTGGFDSAAPGGEWYACVGRRFVEVGDIGSSNMRSKLRRGLKNCEVRRITAEELARTGWEVGTKALERYKGAGPPMDPAEFEARTLADADFEDVVHHWGVYCDGALAGWTITYAFDRTEALYSAVTLDPAYLRRYSSYALFHRMNEHYLVEQGFRYVNNGFRSILHESQIQEFLEHNFGFERAVMRLDTHYAAPYGALIRASFPLGGLMSRIDDRLSALYELERIARATHA